VTSLKKDVKFCVKDLPLPKGVKITQDPELVVAIVQEHKIEEVAPAAATPGPLEPEVIKKEKGEEEAAEGAEKGEKGEKGEKAEKKEAAPKKEGGGEKK